MFSRAAQGFTSDRARLVAALEGFQPRYSARGAEVPDFVAADRLVGALGNVADY